MNRSRRLFPAAISALALALALGSLSLALSSSPSPSSAPILRARTRDGATLQLDTVVSGLEVPWSLAWTSPTRMLVAERPGRVRLVENGVLRKEPLAVIADVESTGETGLMGLAVDPDYERSHLLFLSYAYSSRSAPSGIAVRVARYRDSGDRLLPERTVLEGLPAAQFHAGCRLRFGPDGKLYVTTGDATRREIAQRMDSLGGKTLRLNPDGSIPPDNPFPGSAIYSLGHRNSQGLDWQPGTNVLFETEHGPSGFDGPGGGDEVNRIEPGKNYGWPATHHRMSRAGMVSPLLEFTPAIAPSGATFVRGSKLPSLKGDFVFACLRGERLVRVLFDPADPGRVRAVEDLFVGRLGRLREAAMGPDGALYVTTSNRDGRGQRHTNNDMIIRIYEIN